LGLFGISGAIVFFTYCHFHFHEWNLYFRLEETGWQNHRRWFAILNPLSYVPRFFFENTIDSLNRAAVLWTAIQLVFVFLGIFKGKPSLRWEAFCLYVVSFFLFYIPLTGKANANMDSMLRYTFPVFVLLLLTHARVLPEAEFSSNQKKWGLALAVLSLAFQIWCAYRFTHGHWVA
jgi:hypothetical protein